MTHLLVFGGVFLDFSTASGGRGGGFAGAGDRHATDDMDHALALLPRNRTLARAAVFARFGHRRAVALLVAVAALPDGEAAKNAVVLTSHGSSPSSLQELKTYA